MIPLLLALLLALSACAPRQIVQEDGFIILAFPTRAEVQEVCNRLAEAVLVPLGGCYVPFRDVAVVVDGDGLSTRHEVCHHWGMHHMLLTPEASELYCTTRWHY
jgi:hypothetical protein